MQGAAASAVVGFIKRALRLDRKSYREKQVLQYRLASILATCICLLPLPIAVLFRLFGSDKEQSDGHRYGAAYGSVLRRYRYRPIKLLEIGIGGYAGGLGGESLLAWQAYFPFATIVGCDILPKSELRTRRTRIYTIDQSSAGDLDGLAANEAPFDVVIDDGSHLSAHQIFTFEKLFDAVAEDGLYIIEDIQTSFWPGPVGNGVWDGRHPDDPAFSGTCVGYFFEQAKYLNHQEFLRGHRGDAARVQLARRIRRISFEHNLIIIEKGRNDTPSNILSDHPA